MISSIFLKKLKKVYSQTSFGFKMLGLLSSGSLGLSGCELKAPLGTSKINIIKNPVEKNKQHPNLLICV